MLPCYGLCVDSWHQLDLGLWLVLVLARQFGQATDMNIGTNGPLVLVGFVSGHCPRDGLAATFRMFHHTTVRLQRNKFYLIYEKRRLNQHSAVTYHQILPEHSTLHSLLARDAVARTTGLYLPCCAIHAPPLTI